MIRGLFHLLYPPYCLVCQRRVPPFGEKLCVFCESDLPFGIYPRGEQPLEQVFWGRVRVEGCWSWLRFRKGNLARTLLHQVKYGGSKRIGRYMGQRFGNDLLQHGFKPHLEAIDCVAPVPLHPKKRRKRGFNQAEEIAFGLCKSTSIPLRKHLLKRVEHQSTLTALGRMDRWTHIQGNYAMNEAGDLPQHVLLVDDVVTTGATVEACVLILKAAGVPKVSVACLAYAEKQF